MSRKNLSRELSTEFASPESFDTLDDGGQWRAFVFEGFGAEDDSDASHRA